MSDGVSQAMVSVFVVSCSRWCHYGVIVVWRRKQTLVTVSSAAAAETILPSDTPSAETVLATDTAAKHLVSGGDSVPRYVGASV